jgi:sugar phosphate permease
VTAVIHDLTPSQVHATAIGVYSFFVNLLATTAASVLIGKVADGYGLMAGMRCAVAAQAAGGACFLAVAGLIHSQRKTPVLREAEAGPPERYAF